MSDETGNPDSERLKVDYCNFFDDPLVGFKVEGQFSVIFFNDDPGGLFDCLCSYSQLSNKRAGWNKQAGGIFFEF